jgi:hypothetical protein
MKVKSGARGIPIASRRLKCGLDAIIGTRRHYITKASTSMFVSPRVRDAHEECTGRRRNLLRLGHHWNYTSAGCNRLVVGRILDWYRYMSC